MDLVVNFLVQVPQVTEEIAVAVLDMYPTLLSLASAYSQLVSFFSFIICLCLRSWFKHTQILNYKILNLWF